MPIVTSKTQLEKSFKYLTFQVIKNGSPVKTHTLIINPEELAQEEPARTEAILTLGGAYVEEWGRGLITYNLKGTTGYKKRIGIDGKETDGFQAFKELRNDIYRYYLEPDGKPKQFHKDKYELRFYNWEDGEFYIISPRKFALMRSKNRALLYAYDLTFICIRPILQPGMTVEKDSVVESIMILNNVGTTAKKALSIASNNLRMLLGGA